MVSSVHWDGQAENILCSITSGARSIGSFMPKYIVNFSTSGLEAFCLGKDVTEYDEG